MPGALAPLASYADPAIRRGDPTGTTSVVMKNDKIWHTGGASHSEVRQSSLGLTPTPGCSMTSCRSWTYPRPGDRTAGSSESGLNLLRADVVALITGYTPTSDIQSATSGFCQISG